MLWPRYLHLSRADWQARIGAVLRLMAECRLCPRECRVRRLEGETGVCGVGAEALVASYGAHFGEERPLVGRGGSGAIFLSGCNLQCVFCHNSDISQARQGEPVSARRLAEMMLALQRLGCVNINCVTPTHQLPQILRALAIAIEGGLALPIVYNCGGYESLDALRLLDGIVDLYMPDFKYGDAEAGRRLSGVDDYPAVARTAIREMHRQVGDLEVDAEGVARQGLLVRHLVLPNAVAGTAAVATFLAALSPRTSLNVMGQYRPCYRAGEHPELARRPTAGEIGRAVELARAAGLVCFDHTVCNSKQWAK